MLLFTVVVKCGNLPNPNNGQVSLTGTTFGSRATYTCNKGFSLVGRKMRLCLENGQWMGEAPTCKRIRKDDQIHTEYTYRESL